MKYLPPALQVQLGLESSQPAVAESDVRCSQLQVTSPPYQLLAADAYPPLIRDSPPPPPPEQAQTQKCGDALGQKREANNQIQLPPQQCQQLQEEHDGGGITEKLLAQVAVLQCELNCGGSACGHCRRCATEKVSALEAAAEEERRKGVDMLARTDVLLAEKFKLQAEILLRTVTMLDAESCKRAELQEKLTQANIALGDMQEKLAAATACIKFWETQVEHCQQTLAEKEMQIQQMTEQTEKNQTTVQKLTSELEAMNKSGAV
eukprot:TRINITY_DN2252_c0_g1_i8.p1 TRINITY_DN2252_c0_g1~~TRINITY_DN2252_c0_g1_i8.p1  ORF type:complete len:263 (-),score=74.88 TRINITY_DN2252_c0_g1_i8:45-833(-)